MWLTNIRQAIKSFFYKIFRKKKKEPEFNGFNVNAFLISRVHSRTLGLDLVSVQPMSMPKGILYFLDIPNENVATRKVLFEKYNNPYGRQYSI